jgi:hypothetical protein
VAGDGDSALSFRSVVLEGGIFVSHLIWRFRTREIRAKARSEGETFDDIAREHKEQGLKFKFAERKVGKQSGCSSQSQPAPITSDVEAGTSESKFTYFI